MLRLIGKDIDSVISAGFVYINDEYKYTAYGESVSLKKKVDVERDSRIINRAMGLLDDY